MRCRSCGLVYVGQREHDFTFSTLDPERSRALAQRVNSLGLVDHEVEDAEAPWKRRVHEQRLQTLARHDPGRRLLDVGCSTGDFLAAAAEAGFDPEGVEADPGTGGLARERTGFPVTVGTLEDAELTSGGYEVATLWHVIEHLDSPRRALTELHRVLAPEGLLAIETPAVDTVWFRVLRSRWRQLIPDHYYFFGSDTLRALLTDTGFDVLELRKVGKPMSARFLADRLRRLHPALGVAARRAVRAARAEQRTVHVNLGDIVLVVARRRA